MNLKHLSVLFCLFLVTSCAGAGAGVGVSGAVGGGKHLVPSPEAAAEFDNFLIRQDYNYYYSGTEAYPNALLGLDKRYVLTNDLWKQVDLTPERLKYWLPDMKYKALVIRQSLHGFVIVDDQGNRIGIWYSVLEAASLTQIKLKNNEIWIDTPPQDVYHDFERGPAMGKARIGGGVFFGF